MTRKADHEPELPDAEFVQICSDPELAAAIALAEAEVAAGHLVSHAEVMESLDAIIEAARAAGK